MSVTVPGALAGWDLLVRTHGRRTLAQALQPAIALRPRRLSRLADHRRAVGGRDGVPAGATRPPPRRSCPAAARRRRASGSGTPTTRARSRSSPTAASAPSTAAPSASASSRGSLPSTASSRSTTSGENAPTWVTPISVPFQGYRVWELPPNNQGIAALEMLRILEPYDLKAMGHNSAPYLHHLIEAKKLAYADLDRFVGDADHLDMPAEAMLTDAFIAERRSHLDPLARAGARGSGAAADEERDGLPHHRRRRGQHGVVHQLELRLLRIGRRGAGHRVRPPQPRRGLHARAGTARIPSVRASGRSTR